MPRPLRLARLNQVCWSEVWLTTSSVITRRSRRLASCMKRRKSFIVAEVRVDVAVVGNVVAVVAPGARIERQQPQRGDAEIAQIVEPLGEAGEIADAVAVAVLERLDVQLIDDRVLEPQPVVGGFLRGIGLDGGGDVHCASMRDSGTAKPGSAAGSMRRRTPPHSSRWRSPVTRFSIARTWRFVVFGADQRVAEMQPELVRPCR